MIKATENSLKLYDLIAAELNKVNLELDKDKLSASLNFIIPDEIKFIERIKLLVFIVDNRKEDNDAKRKAYSMLRHIYNLNILNCLADNKSYFEQIKSKLNLYEKVVCCLEASLIGSVAVAEVLFDEECNPKKNHRILSYAICSGNTQWVKELVIKWKVDITHQDYCFLPYAQKFKNESLIDFYKLTKENVQKLESNDNPVNSRLVKTLHILSFNQKEEFFARAIEKEKVSLMKDLFNLYLKEDPLFHFFYEPDIIIRISSEKVLNAVKEFLAKSNIKFIVYDYPNPPSNSNHRYYGETPEGIVMQNLDLFLTVFHTHSVIALGLKDDEHLLYMERVFHTMFNPKGYSREEEGNHLVTLAEFKLES